MEDTINHAAANKTPSSVRGQILQFSQSAILPLKFDEFVCQELMVTLDQAQDFIYEYRRFIALQALANCRLYPSEVIEKVWKIHMVCSKNYIKFCDKICKKVFYHMPYTGDTSGQEDQNNYNMTL